MTNKNTLRLKKIVKNRKTKAFTLLELLVTLLISAIVLTLAMYTLNSFKKITYVFGLQQQTLHEAATLHRLLTQEFANSKQILRTRTGISIEYQDRVVDYNFTKDEYVQRTQNKVVDIFPVYADELKTLYKRKPVYLNSEIADELVFEVEIEGEILPYHFYKPYAADLRMENESKEGL